MERPSLEEVRAHFKNAKIVEDSYGDTVKYSECKIFYNDRGDCWCIRMANDFNLVLWEELQGYAEILEYKKPTPSELVEHFKDAKIIKDHTGFKSKHITLCKDGYLDGGNNYFARVPFTEYSFKFWDSEHGYAEILEKLEEDKVLKREPYDRVALTDTGTSTNFKPDFDFDQTIESTLEHLKELLTVKGKEYRRNGNVFHNFDEGAKVTGKLREEVLHGFRLKHEISVNDMRNDLAREGKLPTKEKVEEKYNDILVYYLIEKASMLDRIDNQKEE